MFIDFNGRNLVISFFIHGSVLYYALDKSVDSQNSTIACIEIEYEQIEAFQSTFNNERVLKLSLIVANAVITEKCDNVPRNLVDINSLDIYLTDKNMNEIFMENFYDKFKAKGNIF
jgi:hypothetical protein